MLLRLIFLAKDFLLQGNPWQGGAGPFLLAASGQSEVEQVLAQARLGDGMGAGLGRGSAIGRTPVGQLHGRGEECGTD